MEMCKMRHTSVVGENIAFEAPFVAENVGEQMTVGMSRNSIGIVVRGHD